jgi:hypothetical protein
MITTIRTRLGDHIFGIDDETLDEVILRKMLARNLKIAIVECGLQGKLIDQLRKANYPIFYEKILSQPCHEGAIVQEFQNPVAPPKDIVFLGVKIGDDVNSKTLQLFLKYNDIEEELSRSFGGSPDLFVPWIINMTLDFLRRNI